MIPPLENGDSLSRREFERRYHTMPEKLKAELIEGRVFMASPVRYPSHGGPDNRLTTLLGVYSLSTAGVHAANNTTVRLDEKNIVQPDGLLFLDEDLGGDVSVSDDEYLEGAPELIAETSGSTASHDLGEKKLIYQGNRVCEYIVWAVHDGQLQWFRLDETGVYVQMEPDENGVIRSQVFPGLWLNIPALLQDDIATILGTLQQGLASPEHQAYVESLKAKAG
ncbi:MAG: Uma2 family endonuclease [Blastocatellia bacterium]